MANYVQEHGIDIGYELWTKGYRVNLTKFTEADFVKYLNAVNQFDDGIEITFDEMFRILLTVHEDWFIDEAAEEEAYVLENEPKLRQYFFDNFYGKSWSEIKGNKELYNNWSFYSDWHKDVYGYRPHGIVCGVYINPYAKQ